MTSAWLARRGRVPRTTLRVTGHALGFALAALVAYLVWRGYQTPDFLLDLANWRLC